MQNTQRQDGLDYPLVTIVIPAKNEERDIARCLKSINQLDYPQDKIEVIVVDNGSTDKTISLVKEFKKASLLNVEGYVGKVRNAGGKKAKGDIIAFLDADCLPPRNWLNKGVTILNSDKTLAIVGACLHLESENTPWIEKLWINYLNVNFAPGINYVDTISSFCFITTKELMNKVGWFNETLATCEDSDLGYRMSELGYKLCIDSTIKTIHLGNAKTLKAFFNRQLWQGGSNLKNVLTHSFSFKELPSILVPLVFIMQILTSLILFTTWHIDWALFSVLLTPALPVLITIKKRHNYSIRVLSGYFIIWSTYLLARGLGMFVKVGRWK